MQCLIRYPLKTDNELLTDKQHDVSKARSYLTNLLEYFEQWTAALDDH